MPQEKRRSNLDILAEKARHRIEALKKLKTASQPSFADIQKSAAQQKNTSAKTGGKPLPQVTNGLRASKVRRHNKPETIIPKPGIVVDEHYKREPYVTPTCKEISVPDWFETTGDIDVSIIVPMHRSRNEIAAQIASWDSNDDGLNKEIIYVSDSCPQNSEDQVIKSWSAKPQPVGKIFVLSNNCGYATACNIGARYARGKYLVFLNADTTVTPDWVTPMHNLFLNDASIGIVGNLQLKNDGSIDSAGSEWMWDNKTFEHIGRNVFQGKRLNGVMKFITAPDELRRPAEREMVTGCCFMIPKDLFNKVDGFDVGYRIGYWEDSDLNMQVKKLGFKVYYQPYSVVYHKSGHSRAGLHPFVMDNVKRFYSKWVDTRIIDNLVKAKRP